MSVSQIVREKGFCGEVSADGQWVCIKDSEHEGSHGDERWSPPEQESVEARLWDDAIELARVIADGGPERTALHTGWMWDARRLARALLATRAKLHEEILISSGRREEILAMSEKLTACERERDEAARDALTAAVVKAGLIARAEKAERYLESDKADFIDRAEAAEKRVRVLDEALVETLNTAWHLLGIVHAEDLSDVRGPEGQLEGEYLASRIAARLHERAALVTPEEGAG